MDHDITPQLRSWLHETIGTIPDPVHLYPAVAADAHAAPRRRGWLPRLLSTGTSVPMLSASKVAVAGTIGALFGGFLLAGMLTQPSEEWAPGSATDSPAPLTTDELLSGWVTEEVEPGVFRVVNDGFRDLAPVADEAPYRRLTIGTDGSIWTWNELDGELHRLGDPISYPLAGLPRDGGIGDLRIDPDGVLWAGGLHGVYRLDGDAWTRLRSDSVRLDISPDGTVWTAWPKTGASLARVARLTPSGWEDYPVDRDLIAEALGVDPSVINYLEVNGFRAAPDGSVWVGLTVDARGWEEADHPLLRFDGQEWVVVDPSGEGRWGKMEYFDIGADGTAWVYLDFQQLARSSGGEWTVYTVEDGVTAIGVPGETWGYLEAGPDGTVWVDETKTSRADDCRGVRSFDGSTWGRYLDGVCVADLDIAPDGAVWVVGAKDPESFRGGRHKSGDWYRIDPAVAEVGDESP